MKGFQPTGYLVPQNPTPTLEKMKTKLHNLRKAIGLTQAQAAQECGVCERTYRDLENGVVRCGDNYWAAETALKNRALSQAAEVLRMVDGGEG